MPSISELAIKYWFGDFGECGVLRDVLTSLDTLIVQTAERAHFMGETVKDIDEIPIDEMNFIEALLGCAFVACQGYIALTVARVSRLHTFAAHPNQGNRILTTTRGDKDALMKACNPSVGSTGYTRIELINSLANYFKHHDEWPHCWNKAKNSAARTIHVVSSMGLCENSMTNLQTGLDALGISSVISLIEILTAWRSKLCNGYRAELQNLGLLIKVG